MHELNVTRSASGLAHWLGVELHFLDAPLDELIERAERRTAMSEWTVAPMARAHFEEWSATFRPPDEDEIRLFGEPVDEV